MTRLGLALFLAHSLFSGPLMNGLAATHSSNVITLRIYNYADVDPDVLARSERQANRVFDRFGVKLEWLYCPTSSGQLSSNRTCSERLGPNHFVINLQPASMSKLYGFRRGVFGVAASSKGGLPGSHISIFFSRVLDLAFYGTVGTSFEDAQAIILGHMIAHEIGHLLLGPDSHGSRGVMRFPWGRRVLQSMERGRLRFTPSEQRRILTELRSRLSSGE